MTKAGDRLSTAFILRPATKGECAVLSDLISRSLRGLSEGCYTPDQVEGALRGSCAVDTQLITDLFSNTIAASELLDRDEDFKDAEREEPDGLLWVDPGAGEAELEELAGLAERLAWTGAANRLSRAHAAWPPIDAACLSRPSAPRSTDENFVEWMCCLCVLNRPGSCLT